MRGFHAALSPLDKFVGLGRKFWCDAGRHMDQPGRIHETVFFNILAHFMRRVKDGGRFLKTTQHVAAHGLEPTRPRCTARLEQATERVQVVTEHAHASRRKDVHKVGVAVIHNVEKIEFMHTTAEITGIVPEPVHQAFGVEGPLPPARAGQICQGVVKRWTDPRGTNTLPVLRSERAEQQLREQVHTGPILLGIVADDRQTREGWSGGKLVQRLGLMACGSREIWLKKSRCWRATTGQAYLA